jgi:TolB protein
MPARLALAAVASLLLAGCGDDASPAARDVPPGRILFSQKAGEHRDIYAVRPDGRGLARLTRSAGEAGAPEPSADGRAVVYEDDESDRAVIAVVDADGGHRRVLTPSGFQGQPAWSPDGHWIVFERDLRPGDNGVWVTRRDGSGLRRLTHNPYAGEECGCDTDPAFSPDGRRISFVRLRRESAGLGALFAIDRAGGHLRRLTPWDLDPGTKHAWKPDGAEILLTRNANAQPGESSNVYVLRPDGSGLHPLTRFRGGKANAIAGAWSPDGRSIAFKSDEGGDFQLYLMAADGSHRRRITSHLDDPTAIAWGP